MLVYAWFFCINSELSRAHGTFDLQAETADFGGLQQLNKEWALRLKLARLQADVRGGWEFFLER